MPAAPGRAAELRAQRKNTERFVRSDRIQLTLNYATTTPDGGLGRRRSAGMQRAPQWFHMGAAANAPVRRTLDGTEAQPEYQLLGEYDVVVERGDWFFIDGVKYEVVFVYPQGELPYEVRADVVYRG